MKLTTQCLVKNFSPLYWEKQVLKYSHCNDQNYFPPQKFQPSESSSRPFSVLQLTGQEDEVLCPAGVLRSLQELDLSPPLGRDASHRESKSRNISPQIFSQWWYKGSITTCAVDIVTFPLLSGFKPERLQAQTDSEVSGDVYGDWTEDGLAFFVVKRTNSRHRRWKVRPSV